ncbi:EAL domain-containing protein [Shewanella sp. 202IG2-18]|nr:EAL domain-containing protein [Parashewanella hymeniacidonis]
MQFMNRLQTRIFAFFVLLLITVQAFSFWMAYYSYEKLEKQQLANRMAVAEKVFRSEFETRSYYLNVFAETAAKDFGLKEIFIDGDTKSFILALNNHRKRINANMAIAVSKEGKVISQLLLKKNNKGKLRPVKGPEQGQTFRYLLADNMANLSQLYELDGKVYQLRFAEITSGGSSVIGWIGFGYLIDSTLANDLQQQTGLSTGFSISGQQANIFAYSGLEIKQNVKNALSSFLTTGTENPDYLLWRQSLGKIQNNDLYAYMYVPRADVLQALQKQWWQQFWLVLLMLPLSMFVAFAISGSITRPIMRLIEQAKFIAQGDYDFKVKSSSTRELAQLAHELNEMQSAIVSREKKIVHQAFHDPLTNLSNRNELDRKAEEWLKNNEHVVVCLINIRRLTDVNLTLGHVVGDEVIKEVGNRLLSIEGTDLVCRLSGDEFAIVYRDFDLTHLQSEISKLQSQVSHSYCYHDLHLDLQITLGLSCSNNGKTLEDIIQQANTALQFAKSHKQDYQVYDKQIDQHSLERFQLVNALKFAIENDQLVLFYQPKLCLEFNKVKQVEALVRWQHPEKGMIPPDVFIPIAEKTGQMNSLTRWVLQEAINQYHIWKSQGLELSIAVNISAANLKDPDFCQWLLDTVEYNNMPVDALTLEITEDAVVEDIDSAIMQLKHWRDNGLKLSIDDFGTGYSSLGQLKELPVHEVKIDRSFVQHLMNNKEDQIIVKSTLELAHNLQLTVVAEGVEDKDTLIWLAEHKCEMAQGYYLSRPIPGLELTGWVLSSGFDYVKA